MLRLNIQILRGRPVMTILPPNTSPISPSSASPPGPSLYISQPDPCPSFLLDSFASSLPLRSIFCNAARVILKMHESDPSHFPAWNLSHRLLDKKLFGLIIFNLPPHSYGLLPSPVSSSGSLHSSQTEVLTIPWRSQVVSPPGASHEPPLLSGMPIASPHLLNCFSSFKTQLKQFPF